MKTTEAQVAAFAELVDETRLLFHRLRQVAEQVHGGGETTAARRGVLQSLRRDGPLTVPQMARQRPVSRQHVQVLVNALLDDGHVELIENPAHKRSKLVRLTLAGTTLIDAMLERERRLVEKAGIDIAATRLRDAAAVLCEVRELLLSERWTETIGQEE